VIPKGVCKLDHFCLLKKNIRRLIYDKRIKLNQQNMRVLIQGT